MTCSAELRDYFIQQCNLGMPIQTEKSTVLAEVGATLDQATEILEYKYHSPIITTGYSDTGWALNAATDIVTITITVRMPGNEKARLSP
jgi:hypothetical protein